MGYYGGRTLLITYTIPIILSIYKVIFYKTSYILKKKCKHLKTHANNEEIMTFWSEDHCFVFRGDVLRRWVCCCWLLLLQWDSEIVLCVVVRDFVSILVFAIILMGKRELVALLFCLSDVSWLLCGSSLRYQRFFRQFVIVVFPDHTHYLLYCLVLFVLLLDVLSQQLWSWRDGQFT